MANYRLFPTTNGPAAPVSYGGPFNAGVVFEVTAGGTWFTGYWWWVCPSGQPTAPQTFALWEVYAQGAASIISQATVTSGTLTAGQWNFVPLANPVMLSVGGGANFTNADAGGAVSYIACTSFTGNFPDTNNQWGSGQPYGAGIKSGPLTAFSAQSGTLKAPFGTAQGTFGVGGSVTTGPPFQGSGTDNFWMDVQVSDTAPTGYAGSYRIWPSQPMAPGSISNDTGQQTFGTEFWLSQACTLNNIWFWSPPGAGQLPSRCGIWNVGTQTVVSGTDNQAPVWSGAAGSGWVSCSYASSGVVLPAGKYKTAVYTVGGLLIYQEDVGYFNNGPGAQNIVNGPLTCPSTANSAQGNSTYQDHAWAYPATFDTVDNGENRWVDVEVTAGNVTASPTPTATATPTPTPTPTQTTPPPTPTINAGGFMTFFP